MKNNYRSDRARSLSSPAAGSVMRLDELQDGFFSLRRHGDGFAVRPMILAVPRKAAELMGLDKIRIFSPADGAVTAAENYKVSLRTADGINVTVFFGESVGGQLLTSVGRVLRCGEEICLLSRQQALENGFGGAVITLFTRPVQISELHIDTGFRRAGDRAAFFRLP